MSRTEFDWLEDAFERLTGAASEREIKRLRAELAAVRKAADEMHRVMVQAVEAVGFAVSGPTDSRAAEHGEPAWVCNARAAIAAYDATREGA